MIETKVFEIRDRMTCVPILAIAITADHSDQGRLCHRAGFGPHNRYILYAPLDGGRFTEITYDPFHWSDRTHTAAHQFIIDQWDTLTPGQVVDVQFILGETTAPKPRET